MRFIWHDYNPASMSYVEDWLDEAAVRTTGLDEDFRHFYCYWAHEDGFIPGQNFWCKVACQNDQPLAVIAFCLHEERIIIMELVVAPQRRGQGIGTKLLQALLNSKEIIGMAVRQYEAVIFPGNIASQRAFEHAGFRYHHTHEDGASMLYVYSTPESAR